MRDFSTYCKYLGKFVCGCNISKVDDPVYIRQWYVDYIIHGKEGCLIIYETILSMAKKAVLYVRLYYACHTRLSYYMWDYIIHTIQSYLIICETIIHGREGCFICETILSIPYNALLLCETILYMAFKTILLYVRLYYLWHTRLSYCMWDYIIHAIQSYLIIYETIIHCIGGYLICETILPMPYKATHYMSGSILLVKSTYTLKEHI